MKFSDKAVVFLATGFYIGHIPFAPGTFGTLLGLPISLILARLMLSKAAVIIVFLLAIAVWIAGRAEITLKESDPGCIVIDEIAGIVVALYGLPFNLTTALIGFIIFRILDVAKPFPIRYLEQRLSGGVGVVMDDVAAGVLANIFLRIIISII